jgi:site-specific DNA-methyltransferase (adenine-specific)
MSFGTTLAELRSERKMSMRNLAGKLNIDHAYISRLEKGTISPSERVVRDIARLLGVSVEELSLSAGKLPTDIAQIFYEHPREAALFLRERFGGNNGCGVPNSPESNHHNGANSIKLTFQTQRGLLYQGDCLQLLPAVPDETIDCVFADPPFNLGKDYGSKINDNLAEARYVEWSYQWLGELVRVLKPGGSLFVYNLPKWNTLFGAFLSKQLIFRHWIAVDIKTSLPIPGRLYPSHYSLLYFTKGRPKIFNRPRVPIPQCRHCGGDIKDYGGHRKYLNPAGLNLTDVWNDIPPVRHQKYKSRTANELSTKLLQRVLEISTEKGDLVLDPFGGGGTTYYVSEMLERRWIGCEIGDCRPIIRRLRCNLFTGATSRAA